MDVPVAMVVIRLAFREVEFIFNMLSLLVVAGTRKGVLAALLILFFEKLNQAINQAATAANHMQTALVLVLFQDFVQVLFQFGHRISPLECRSSGARPKPDISFFQGIAAED